MQDSDTGISQIYAGPLSTQVGGNHYKDMPIQPAVFAQKNKLTFCEASAIKYICRHRNKGGIQDIDKAIHFLQMLKQIEYDDYQTMQATNETDTPAHR